MAKVEFIYDLDCPNVEGARSNLVAAFAEAKLAPKWTEWDRNADDSPSYAKKYGSPTILVDGKDIAQQEPASGNNCRIYGFGENSGIPPVGLIVSSLTGENRSDDPAWKTSLAAIPGISIVLLPKLTCAACWPAYAAIMSSMGFGFFNYTEYLFPISLIALLVTLAALAYKANTRRGYGPLGLGTFASLVALIGKFHIESDLLFYAGVIALVAASIWNSWPKRNVNSSQACSACENR